MAQQETASPPQRQSRFSLFYHRLAMAWQGRRAGRGQAVALHSDESGLVAVDVGTRTICVPHPRLAADFRTGVEKRLDAVAEKYLGNTGYEPREGDVIVDIGAGLGEFALWSAAAGAHVIAFEPDSLAFECLQKNTASLSNVEIHQFALWKERANLRLHGSSDTRESSLIEDGKSNSRNSDVAAWPLDQVPFLTRLPVIDLMKIDGEGVEPEIIVGGTRTLRRVRIVAIDIGATDRRPNLKARVTSALTGENFRIVDHGRSDTILALNVAMVGPTNNRVLVRRGS